MNDLFGLLKALGYALVKLLISASVAVGVALLIVGYCELRGLVHLDNRSGPEPLGVLLMAAGAGLLAFTVMLLLLFFIPWRRRDASPVGRAAAGRSHEEAHRESLRTVREASE